MKKGTLSHLAIPGTTITVRVTPKASRNAVLEEKTALKIWVTVPPEDGKANKAVEKLLATTLGISKSRLTLAHGATSRDKVFRIT